MGDNGIGSDLWNRKIEHIMNKKTRTKKIRIGLDFDGVVAYNPLRIVRGPITYVKRRIFGAKKTKFYVPKSPIMKALFWIPHQFSFLPERGMEYLRQLVESGDVEVYIVSGRYGYLDDELIHWLTKHGYHTLFKEIIVNRHDEQPHLFKERQLKTLKLDYFIEDNFDIVEHLSALQQECKILWIYNILDKYSSYPRKYPDLLTALTSIHP